MDFDWCQPPCSRLIASEDQHGKCVICVRLAHARDAIFGISNCKYCENFILKTLHARLAFFDRESGFLPRRAAPEASFLREAVAWSSEAELEAMESEQFSLTLPPSPGSHWLILSSSREQVILHRDPLLLHLRALGLRLNGQKSVLTPAQQTNLWESVWTQPRCRPVWPLLG